MERQHAPLQDAIRHAVDEKARQAPDIEKITWERERTAWEEKFNNGTKSPGRAQETIGGNEG